MIYDMKRIFFNFCLIGSVMGFVFYLLLIILSFIGCCVGMGVPMFYGIIAILTCIITSIFGYCMFRNCRVRLGDGTNRIQ